MTINKLINCELLLKTSLKKNVRIINKIKFRKKKLSK